MVMILRLILFIGEETWYADETDAAGFHEIFLKKLHQSLKL